MPAHVRNWRETAWPMCRATLVGLGLVYVMTAPTLTHPTSVGRLDTNDGRFSIWNVGWIGHAILTEPATVLDANIFSPHTGTLAYSELNLVAGILGLPWYAATGSAVAALNGAAATALVLAFVCMWALARRLSGSDAAGLVAAAAFTFCPFVSARTPHIQLLMIFSLPLVMLCAHRLIERPHWTRGVELGAALGVAALACGYYGIYAGCAVGFMALVMAGRTRHYWIALVTAAATAAVIVAPVFYAFTMARALSGSSLLARGGEAADWSANPAAYLASGAASHAVWMGALAAWQPWSDVLFPGVGALVLAMTSLALLRRSSPHRRLLWTYGALTLLALWASFGPHAGLYRLLELTVPGMSLVRAPARFGIVVTFGIATMAAFSVARLAEGRRWLAPVLVIAIACELGVRTDEWGWPSWPLRSAPAASEAHRRLASLPRGVVVEFPFPYVRTDFHNHAQAMFWSTYHWQPMVNGYSDVTPADFPEIALPINGFPDPESFAIARQRDVRYVLWRIRTYDARSRAVLEQRLARYEGYLVPILRAPDGWLYQIVKWPE